MTDEARHAETDATIGVSAWLVVYFKGVAMGTADSVPGVSGGTIALIAGIYERLISAIATLDPRAARHLLRIHRSSGRTALYRRLLAMDVPFLLVLGTGVVTALILVSRVMHVALNEARALTFAFFFGLIAASAVVLYEHVSVATPGRVGAGIAGFVLAFLVSGVSTGSEASHALPVVFVAGAIAITAMILPGVSGAFFLVMGQYDHLAGASGSLVLQGGVQATAYRSKPRPTTRLDVPPLSDRLLTPWYRLLKGPCYSLLRIL